jgi:hypothetical protein
LDLDSDDDSSSSAGQSGWSSSQGLSSLNTASFDAGEDGSMLSGGATGRHVAAGGSALAAIGVASAVTYNTVKKSSPPQKMVKQRYADDDDGSISSEEGMAAAVSRKDLDAAIEGRHFKQFFCYSFHDPALIDLSPLLCSWRLGCRWSNCRVACSHQ